MDINDCNVKMWNIRVLLIGLVMACVCTSCTLETSDNGRLDGFWHLVKVDTVSTGGTLDLNGERLFWAFQGTLLDNRDADGHFDGCISHFEYAGDSIFILDSYLNSRVDGDPALEDAAALMPYGINEIGEHFYVQQLESDRMTLRSETLILRFRKM